MAFVPSMSEVNVASESDRAAATAALAEAFMDDPVAIWATPKDHHRPRVLRRFFGALYDAHLDEEVVYVDSERRPSTSTSPPSASPPTAKENASAPAS